MGSPAVSRRPFRNRALRGAVEIAKSYHAVASRKDDLWHTRVNTPGTHATATHASLLDAWNWARDLGATTFEVPDHATLNAFFAKAGYEAGRKLGDELTSIANANRIDNFTLWIARTIDGGIIDAFNMHDDDHCAWFSLYCWNVNAPDACRRGHDNHRPSDHPFVIPIAHRLYREFHRA
jgi:hypothetical protein